MVKIRAFQGYVCKPDLADKLLAPAYDTLDSNEARIRVKGNEYSFLHVNKPEVDLPESVNIYDDKVYAQAKTNLDVFIQKGWLQKDDKKRIYAYSQQFTSNFKTTPQIGLMIEASIEDYEQGIIKKHELTRKEKEADRTKITDIQNANIGPVFLAYEDNDEINKIVAKIIAEKPYFEIISKDDNPVKHTLWKSTEEQTKQLEQLFKEKIKALYIADGHHRAASAYNVGSQRRELKKKQGLQITGEEEFNFFMALCYPKNQLQIFEYNRVIKNYNNHTPQQILDQIKQKFDIEESKTAVQPKEKRHFGLYIEKKWYKLQVKPQFIDNKNSVTSLDVEILTNNVITPIFGIQDLRTSHSIDFIGGIRGIKECEKRCHEDCLVALSLAPVVFDDIINVANEKLLMPPKSTWFEPKPLSGAVVRVMQQKL